MTILAVWAEFRRASCDAERTRISRTLQHLLAAEAA